VATKRGKRAPEWPTVDDATMAALRDYAGRYGQEWKRRLTTDWMRGAAGPYLQHLRNTHGPEWLATFTIPD
jgi:hypothetical protein